MFYPVVASVTIFLLYTFVKLASTSPQSLCPSLGHANTVRIFSACRRPCWRLVPRKAFILRRATPTRLEFSRFPGAFVGALFPAKPLSFVGSRQHGPVFPAHRCPCWRLVPRKAFFLRRATPTRPEFSRFAGALVGALFPASPYSFVGARQHGPVFPGPSVPLLLQFPRKKKK